MLCFRGSPTRHWPKFMHAALLLLMHVISDLSIMGLYTIFLVHNHIFHRHTLIYGQSPIFLLTLVILVGVTCGSIFHPYDK